MAKSDLRQFDYQEVAKLDNGMWRSYYNLNHDFFGLFLRALKLVKNQLRFSWYVTIRLAYYAGRAAVDYRLKKGKENYPRTLRSLIKFFKTISTNCIKPFDYKRAAELELEWWDIHRYPDKYKKTLEQSLAENMAVIYGVDASRLKGYGHNRASALLLLNQKGVKHKSLPYKKKIAELLEESWRSLYSAVQE